MIRSVRIDLLFVSNQPGRGSTNHMGRDFYEQKNNIFEVFFSIWIWPVTHQKMNWTRCANSCLISNLLFEIYFHFSRKRSCDESISKFMLGWVDPYLGFRRIGLFVSLFVRVCFLARGCGNALFMLNRPVMGSIRLGLCLQYNTSAFHTIQYQCMPNNTKPLDTIHTTQYHILKQCTRWGLCI